MSLEQRSHIAVAKLVPKLERLAQAPEPDAHAIIALLRDLENVRVTKEILRDTGAGKRLQKVRKLLVRTHRHTALHVKKIISMWKENVIASEKSTNTADGSRATCIALEQASEHRVPSLQSICLSVLRKNIPRIGKLQAIPIELAMSVFQHANASNLARVQKLNPHIAENLDIFWEALCRQDLAQAYEQDIALAPEKKPPAYWREFYQKVLDQRAQREQLYAKHLEEKQLQQQQSKSASAAKKLHMSSRDAHVRKKRSRKRSSSFQLAPSSNPAKKPASSSRSSTGRAMISNIRRQLCRKSQMEKTQKKLARSKRFL